MKGLLVASVELLAEGFVWATQSPVARVWLEAWRNPYLALVLMCRDPAWKVCEEDPGALGHRDGWSGPRFLHLDWLRVGVYVDERLEWEASARIADALAFERKGLRQLPSSGGD